MRKLVAAMLGLVLGLIAFSGIASAGSTTPPNDDIGSATPIGDIPFFESIDATGATLESDEAQPSCLTIRSSVWYRITLSEDRNLSTLASGGFRLNVAVFHATPSGLEEISCQGGGPSSQVDFRGLAGQTYLVQLGATGDRQGLVDFSLRPARWQERRIHRVEYVRDSEDQHFPLLEVRGRPRESDRSMYEVTVRPSDQEPRTLSVNTFGLVTQGVDLELIRIPGSSTKVFVELWARYDASQKGACQAELDRSCLAQAPFKDLNWLTSGEASRAELVITVSAVRNGESLLERSVAVPYGGQLIP